MHKIAVKILKLLLVLAAAAALLAVGANVFIIGYAGRYIITAEQAAARDADCALVLGARVMPSGNPSAMLEDRLKVGVELYRSGATGRILVSGDHGQTEYDEVNAMKQYAVESGVPADAVFMDHAGFSTYESAYRAAAVFQVKSALVVTQKYHLYRAVFLARVMGIEAYGVSATLRDYRNDFYDNVREALARVKAAGMAIIKPEPTFLGDAIPIWGSGSATDDTNAYRQPVDTEG
jgi:vancomycin permeability regulator SanA